MAWTPEDGPITAQGATDVVFRTTRMREGYDIDEVDAFLDGVTATLQGYEAQPAASTVDAPPFSPPAAAPPADALGPLRTELGLRDLMSQLQLARVKAGSADDVSVALPDGTTLRISSVEIGPQGVMLRTA